MIKMMLGIVGMAGMVSAAVPTDGTVAATEFTIERGFYKDNGTWLAVNPDTANEGSASLVFPYREGPRFFQCLEKGYDQ